MHRKAYLGFDLSGIDPKRIADAELALQCESTGWGLASLVPDATFAIYGLLTKEPWDENSINGDNAPAHRWRSVGGGGKYAGTPRLVPDKVRKLGAFVIEQGVQRGEFGIKGEALAKFLRELGKKFDCRQTNGISGLPHSAPANTPTHSQS